MHYLIDYDKSLISEVLSLVESAYSSLKAFFDEVRSRLDRAREIDIVILGLAYNVARLVTKGEIKTKRHKRDKGHEIELWNKAYKIT